MMLALIRIAKPLLMQTGTGLLIWIHYYLGDVARPLGPGLMGMGRGGLVVTRKTLVRNALCHFLHGDATGSSVPYVTSLGN